MRKLIYGMNLTLDGYIAAPGDESTAAGAFLEALAKHRHFGREMDPPLV